MLPFTTTRTHERVFFLKRVEKKFLLKQLFSNFLSKSITSIWFSLILNLLIEQYSRNLSFKLFINIAIIYRKKDFVAMVYV